MLKLRDMSLKTKPIGLLTFLTGTMLSIFAILAVSDFKTDKITYVLETSFSQTKALALQTRTEINYHLERIKFLTRGFNAETGRFHPYTESLFPNEAAFSALFAHRLDPVSGELSETHRLIKNTINLEQEPKLTEAIQVFQRKEANSELGFARPFDDDQWLVFLRPQSSGDSKYLISALMARADFLRQFEIPHALNLYLTDANGNLVAQAKNPTHPLSNDRLHAALQFAFAKTEFPEGVFHFEAETDHPLLLAVASPGVGGLRIVSMVPKKAALEAVRKLIFKAFLFLGLLFAVTVFLSVVSTATITASLKQLLFATSSVAKGDFQVTVSNDAKDEIGTLAQSFNKMTDEIRRLVQETAEKARMQNELKTAQVVQSTLFPEKYSLDQDLEICGFYEPASECSGDWWYYTRIGEKTLFCIGDATGHGAPAALLTAAARSAASALETFPELTVSQMMQIFNRSVYSTAKGHVLMTLFLGLYDPADGTLHYCNASHEPPYVIPPNQNLKKKDLSLLNDVLDRRLGDSLETEYKTATHHLEPGERIVLYTDGVTELKGPGGEMWGERSLVKALLDSANKGIELRETIDQIHTELQTFRQDHPLHDDVTYFIVTRLKSA